MRATFTAQLDGWVKQTKERMLAVTQESSQRVIDAILLPRSKGGNLRVDTGFMRSSFRVSLNSPQLGIQKNPGGVSFPPPDSDINLVIAGMHMGDTLYGLFGAEYAVYREYGANGQPPDGMVRLAAQRWPEIVYQVTLEAKALTGS